MKMDSIHEIQCKIYVNYEMDVTNENEECDLILIVDQIHWTLSLLVFPHI